MDLKNLNKLDPIKRTVERQTEQAEFSPMDPPDAYAPPGAEPVPYEEMPTFLRSLMDEHKACLERLGSFENILGHLQEHGLDANPDINAGLGEFFSFVDETLVRHNLKEEKVLFPKLQEHLLHSGEHSQGRSRKTAVDMFEDDHVRLMQLAAITFNFLGLAPRLPDPVSRAMVLDAAVEQGKAMIEHLRLHIFREEHIAFSLAARQFSPDDLTEMETRATRF